MATNISLIADVQAKELVLEPNRPLIRKWFWAATVVVIAVVGFILAGTYVSKERYVKVVRKQADEVLRENNVLLEEVSHRLNSGKREDIRRINEIRAYLTNQRRLAAVANHLLREVGERPAFFQENDYVPPRDEDYVPSYFACTLGRDCEYLKKFFSGETVEVLEKYGLRDDQFYIYIPFVGRETRYILLFERQKRYGKFGS